jgi:hypothetical protein
MLLVNGLELKVRQSGINGLSQKRKYFRRICVENFFNFITFVLLRTESQAYDQSRFLTLTPGLSSLSLRLFQWIFR